MPVAKQRHHALVRLLSRQLVPGVQRDGAAPQVAHVDELTQGAARLNSACHRRRCAQGHVGLHFGHRQLHRAIAKNLQNQRAVELDGALHQRARRRHFTQQVHHFDRITTGSLASLENFLPGVRQAHQQAAHRQAVKKEFMKFRHVRRIKNKCQA